MNDNAEEANEKRPAYAVVIGRGAVLTTPYDADYIEAFRTVIPRWARQFDEERRRWGVQPPYVDDALDVAAQFFDLVVDDWRPVRAFWVRAMFLALPRRLHADVYRALMSVFRAEFGGSEAAAEDLDEAYERRRHRVAS